MTGIRKRQIKLSIILKEYQGMEIVTAMHVERNTEIVILSENGNFRKAAKLSADIEDFRLTCGDHWSAWLRMKILFFDYYMDNCEFEKATEIALILERRISDKKRIPDMG